MNDGTTNNQDALRSGWEFGYSEKAYHVYMYVLQNRSYRTSIKEYALEHGIKPRTLSNWFSRYPKGRPYYDADAVAVPEAAPEAGLQLVKLSPAQVGCAGNAPECPDGTADRQSPTVTVSWSGAEIRARLEDLGDVLLAIRSVSGRGL